MSRSITDNNAYEEKVLKLIPTEIVGAYMFLSGVVGAGASASPGMSTSPNDQMNTILLIVIFFALLLLTPLYLWRISNVTNIVQLAVTTLSYVVWVYTLGGPFVIWHLYYPVIASVVLVIWSLAMPLLVPTTPATPAAQAAPGT